MVLNYRDKCIALLPAEFRHWIKPRRPRPLATFCFSRVMGIEESFAGFSPFISAGTKPAPIEENKMKLRVIAAAGLVSAFVVPAFAADEFYVVQDVKTKKCTIVDKKPADTSMTVVSPSGTMYKTRAEAETGMRTVKVCSSD
jgi:hypothetical protein